MFSEQQVSCILPIFSLTDESIELLLTSSWKRCWIKQTFPRKKINDRYWVEMWQTIRRSISNKKTSDEWNHCMYVQATNYCYLHSCLESIGVLWWKQILLEHKTYFRYQTRTVQFFFDVSTFIYRGDLEEHRCIYHRCDEITVRLKNQLLD
jgi:hypothetical protein